jgi:hypothetical protein
VIEMVKQGSDRSDKYAAKFDPTVIQARYTATSTAAKAAQVTQQQNLSVVAQQVRTALNAHSVPAIFTVPYMAFGNKLYAIVRKFGSATFLQVARDEAWKAICQWYGLGCLPSPLQDIWNNNATVLGTAPSPIMPPTTPV